MVLPRCLLCIDLHSGAQGLIDSHVSLQVFDGESKLLPRMCNSPPTDQVTHLVATMNPNPCQTQYLLGNIL